MTKNNLILTKNSATAQNNVRKPQYYYGLLGR